MARRINGTVGKASFDLHQAGDRAVTGASAAHGVAHLGEGDLGRTVRLADDSADPAAREAAKSCVWRMTLMETAPN